MAVDFFDITVEDAIGSIPAQASLDGCIAGGDGSGTFCSLIQRDTAGTLWLSNDAPGGGLAGISQQNANITSLTTEGIDINVTYGVDLSDWGSINVDYAATILDTLDTVPFAGADVIACRDFYAGQWVYQTHSSSIDCSVLGPRQLKDCASQRLGDTSVKLLCMDWTLRLRPLARSR